MVYPLANLLATEQIRFGDMLVIDWDEEDQRISFHREGQGAVIPAPSAARRARTAAHARSCRQRHRGAEQDSAVAGAAILEPGRVTHE